MKSYLSFEKPTGNKTINGVKISLTNFPGNDGTDRNITRRVRGYGIVTITDLGFVTYKADAQADSEICGKLGEEFKSESELLAFIGEEFE